MRNTYRVIEEREVEVTLSVFCNKCGHAIERDRFDPNQFKDHVHIRKVWGFFSTKDLIMNEVDICEKCWDAWLETFVIPVRAKCSLDEPL